jgi:hypothetical protein
MFFRNADLYLPYGVTIQKRPNVVVVLLRVQEVAGSKLGLKTGFSDEGFSWFFSAPPVETLIDYNCFFANPFHQSPPCHSTLYSHHNHHHLQR